MPKEEKHADPNSMLGQLQRGRGEGYRRILSLPRREAWDNLLQCICNDPRLDSQVEDRALYYASMAIETQLGLEPLLHYVRDYDHDDGGWNTPLAVQTLGELAKRGYKDAAQRLCDYLTWGQWWDWILDDVCAVRDPALHREVARKVEQRFPVDSDLEEALAWFDLDVDPWATLVRHSTRISDLKSKPRKLSGIAPEQPLPSNLGSFSVGQLLELADERNRHKLRKMIKQVVKPCDVELLTQSVSMEKPFVTDVALAGLAQLAPPPILSVLTNFWSANLKMPPFLRVRIYEVLVALPPDLTLPFARQRLHHPEGWERHLAEELFEAHALPEDIPLLRNAIGDALRDDEENCYRLCNLVEAFFNLPNCGPIPELSSVFIQFRYSYGRARAARAIDITAPGYFSETFAEECLWDCEAHTRMLGARTAPANSHMISTRLRCLASDIWEEKEVQEEAQRRLSGQQPL